MIGRKSFLISAGNSDQGPVGFCARVRAETKEDAVQKLQAVLPECMEVLSYLDPDERADIEYFNVYCNYEKLTVADIEDGETEDVDEEGS
jgi:hypothetical protein